MKTLFLRSSFTKHLWRITDGQEDDLPEPEAIAKEAIVQVIVQRRKRKTFEDTLPKTASKRSKKGPVKLLN